MRAETMKKDKYGSMLIMAVLVLFVLMMGTLHKINQEKEALAYAHQKETAKQHGFVVPPLSQEVEINILSSAATASYYANNGSSMEVYQQRLVDFGDFLRSIGYKSKMVPVEKLSTIAKKSVLFVLDMQVMSEKNRVALKKFVAEGGAIFFNFMSGFNDENGKYQAEKFVNEITTLSLSKKGFARFKDGLTITPKLLSAFSQYTKKGELLPVSLYDELPIYDTNEKQEEADIYLTDYAQISPPRTKNSTSHFTNSEAAVAWHGYYGAGKWVYTSLPSYAFYDMDKHKETYKKILAGMVSYLSQEVEVQAYPYIDQKSVVFVSEDTEYKFTNFKRFADLSKEYKMPVTAFIVASLAVLPEHQEMMAEIKKNPYVEFGSHSTTHKKIVGESEAFVKSETANSKTMIDPLAPFPIKGFRPPREEINDLMKKYLASSGFGYVLEGGKEYLYPIIDKKEPNLLLIPRHGTDDYSFLVNLDWNQDEIVKRMIQEAAFVTSLNGIYTLSVHTHLFSYDSNIEIIRAFYEHIKSHAKELKPLSGAALVERVLAYKKIEVSTKMHQGTLVITVKNNHNRDIKNLHLKLFKNPKLKISDGRASKEINVTLHNYDDAVIIVDNLAAKSTATIYISFKK